MSRQIFLVYFLLLFVCCQLCGQGCAAQAVLTPGNGDENLIDKFLKSDDHTEINFKHDKSKAESCKITVKHIESVYLVAANGVIVALADASDKENKENDTNINFVAKFIETKGKDWNQKTVKASSNEWKTQLLTKDATTLKSKDKVKSSAVVAKGSKIYYLFVTNSTVENGLFSQDATGNSKWHVAVIVGEITSGDQQTAAVKWETLQPNKLTKVEELDKNLKATPDKIPSTMGFSFANGEKIVFAIQGEGEESNANKNAIVFFTFDTTQNKLEFLDVKSTEKCSSLLFLWKEEIVMTPTVCESSDESNPKMKVFDYEKKQFNNSDRPIFRLHEFLRDKKNFVTTKINTETKTDTTTEVLLFTQQRKTKKPKESENYEIYLWVTDGNRTAKVDTIITGDKSKENFDVSILYTNNDLFVLYSNYGAAVSRGVIEGKSTYNLKRLPDQMAKIKKTLEAWNTIKNNLKQFCEKRSATVIPCSTDGLVGFLSNKSNGGSEWADEYEYANANVNKGKKLDNGFQFDLPGAGAQWLIGEKDGDQLYNFADFGFTLVATVTIDMPHKNKELRPVLGVSTGKNKKSVGVWCLKENMIIVKENKEFVNKAPGKTYVVKKEYQVALVYNRNKISVYIDWESLVNEYDFEINTNTQKQLQFYFGNDNTESNVESDVTVTNVLLYNRPFNAGEIEDFKKYVKPAEVTKENTKVQQTENTETTSDPQPPTQPTDSDEKKEDKKEPSPSRTEDGGVDGGVRVFSLLLAVLCVSAPLLHL